MLRFNIGSRVRHSELFLATGYTWYRAAITERESASNKAETTAQKLKTGQAKDLVGRALASGNQLLSAQVNQEPDQADKDAKKWIADVHALITSAFGDGEAGLFMDDSGYVFYGDASRTSKIRNLIDGRMRRLTDLLKRADGLGVKDFDPTKFTEPSS
jgi:hypothetical protein